jgi:hypothetical protein
MTGSTTTRTRAVQASWVPVPLIALAIISFAPPAARADLESGRVRCPPATAAFVRGAQPPATELIRYAQEYLFRDAPRHTVGDLAALSLRRYRIWWGWEKPLDASPVAMSCHAIAPELLPPK